MAETATVDPTPAPAAAATPATQEPAATGNGTVQTSGSEAAGAAPSEETFFSGDPNSLPPELQQAYKNMLKDYKQKTQSIAETRKKADAYDFVSKDQRFIDYWNGLNRQQKVEYKEQKAEAEKRLGEKISDEEFTKAFNSKDDFLSFMERIIQDRSEKSQKEINSLKEQLSVKDAADVVESFATQVDKATGQLVRPDFYSLDEDQLITGYLTINKPEEASERAYISKLNEAYAWARQVSQKYYEKGKTDALARIQQKAASSTEMPTNAAKGAYTGPNPKTLSVRDAMELAKKGIRVPRDD